MIAELTYILIAVIVISLISLVGILSISFKKSLLNRVLSVFVAFAAGSLLATAFFDLIPESFELLGRQSLTFVLMGIIGFFILEAFIHWHHSHGEECENCLKPVVYLNLFGDSLHNFLDGLIIAASFLVNIQIGIASTIAISLHEIPQEIGDFAVLIHGGLSKSKALLFNFLSALFAVIGGVFGFLFLSKLQDYVPFVVALAGGGFLYIATADLFPQLHEEKNYLKIISQIIALILGILLIVLIFSFFPD
tara:strand:+ start:1346 stop:2095 length:750 start_codon:yes stop_codon:yes gene_type:complete